MPCERSIPIGRTHASNRNSPGFTCVEIPDLFSLFVRPVHRSGLRYMVSGALASVFYGEPRLTMDVDLVVHLGGNEAATLIGLFSPEHYYGHLQSSSILFYFSHNSPAESLV